MTTGGVKVELSKGNVWTLRYTNPSLSRLENETGLTMDEHNERMAKGSIVSINAIVWAGLIHAEPNVTIDRVAERIDLRNLEAISESVATAVKSAFGHDEAEEAPEEQNPPTAE